MLRIEYMIFVSLLYAALIKISENLSFPHMSAVIQTSYKTLCV